MVADGEDPNTPGFVLGTLGLVLRTMRAHTTTHKQIATKQYVTGPLQSPVRSLEMC